MNNNQQDGVIRMAEKSAVQRIKELDDERATIFYQAKEEALQKATQAVADLNALGLNYQLIMRSGKSEEKQLNKAAKPR
jgi:vacuolar-type H+-ATPase subunit H